MPLSFHTRTHTPIHAADDECSCSNRSSSNSSSSNSASASASSCSRCHTSNRLSHSSSSRSLSLSYHRRFSTIASLSLLLLFLLLSLLSSPLVTATTYKISDACRSVLPTCTPGGPCPDLILDSARVARTLRFETDTFVSSDCAVVEGCASVGTRMLLRFDIGTPNIGTGDLHLGNPSDPHMAPCFIWSPCHAHYHFYSFSQYQLFAADGTAVAAGAKAASCVMDAWYWGNNNGTVSQDQLYTCQNQGIHAGYQDVYNNYLDCQWVDVTALSPGTYRMLVTVNPEYALAESDYSNNAGECTYTCARQRRSCARRSGGKRDKCMRASDSSS